MPVCNLVFKSEAGVDTFASRSIKMVYKKPTGRLKNSGQNCKQRTILHKYRLWSCLFLKKTIWTKNLNLFKEPFNLLSYLKFEWSEVRER